MLSYYKYSWT